MRSNTSLSVSILGHNAQLIRNLGSSKRNAGYPLLLSHLRLTKVVLACFQVWSDDFSILATKNTTRWRYESLYLVLASLLFWFWFALSPARRVAPSSHRPIKRLLTVLCKNVWLRQPQAKSAAGRVAARPRALQSICHHFWSFHVIWRQQKRQWKKPVSCTLVIPQRAAVTIIWLETNTKSRF